MGEAKRREELGLPPRQKKVELNKSDRYISWLPINKSRIKKYPYMGVAKMALGAKIFLVSGGANSSNQLGFGLAQNISKIFFVIVYRQILLKFFKLYQEISSKKVAN